MECTEVRNKPKGLNSSLEEARRSGVLELYYIDPAMGLRRGELLGLQWSDIDLARGSSTSGGRSSGKMGR